MGNETDDWRPPPVRDMTDLTGRNKNEHRRTVFLGYSMNRAIIPMALVALVLFGISAIFFLPFGPIGFVFAIVFTVLGFAAVYYRVSKAMDQRAYKAMRDWLNSANGIIHIDQQQVREPQLVWHHPLWLDRDPDEMRDVDVVYVMSSNRRGTKRRTWMNTELTVSNGKKSTR